MTQQVFLHYARTRATISEPGVLVYMESDALGAYLANRLGSLIDGSRQLRDDDQRLSLDYHSAVINQYFTMSELGVSVEEPSTGVPLAIRDALRTCAPDYPSTWVVIATAVMTAPLKTWQAWRHFLRRHKNEKTLHHPRH